MCPDSQAAIPNKYKDQELELSEWVQIFGAPKAINTTISQTDAELASSTRRYIEFVTQSWVSREPRDKIIEEFKRYREASQSYEPIQRILSSYGI